MSRFWTIVRSTFVDPKKNEYLNSILSCLLLIRFLSVSWMKITNKPKGKSGNSGSPACRLTKWEVKQSHQPGITGSDEHSLHREKLCFGLPPSQSCTADVQQAPSDRLQLMSACAGITVIAGWTSAQRPCLFLLGRAVGRVGGWKKFLLASFQQQNHFCWARTVMRNHPSALISSFNISPCQKYSLSS